MPARRRPRTQRPPRSTALRARAMAPPTAQQRPGLFGGSGSDQFAPPVVRRGMQIAANPYGWAVPNWTYNASQYAPGPRPAPKWPTSSYSVYGGTDFLTESSEFRVPNWALLAGAGYALYRMRDGRTIPVRKNFVLLGTTITVGMVGIAVAVLLATVAGGTAMGMIGNAFKGPSGAGLFLGLALGAGYGLKTKSGAGGAAMAGALMGWGVGMAYEMSQEPEEEAGILTRTWDVFI